MEWVLWLVSVWLSRELLASSMPDAMGLYLKKIFLLVLLFLFSYLFVFFVFN